MFMKKLCLFTCCFLCVTSVVHAAAAKKTAEPRKAKEPVEVAVPAFNDDTYAKLNDLDQQIVLAKKQNELESVKLDNLAIKIEQNKRIKELAPPPPPVVVAQPEVSTKKEVKKEKEIPIFPMPGGNPTVKSTYTANGKWEAELVLTGGTKAIVRSGDMLSDGYRVKSVGLSGVILEKNGKTEVLSR